MAVRLAHRPGSLLSSLEPFARNSVNLLKIESRPIHGRPWEYQFFIDVEADSVARLEQALREVRAAAHEVRVLGLYPAAQNRSCNARGQRKPASPYSFASFPAYLISIR